ncbi:MAG: taurine dioxygenase [Bacteroidota bacterium]
MIQIETIRSLLMGQDEFIEEFATASIDSFGEFADQLKIHLPARNTDAFRRAGHKIKPVAQMLEQEDLLNAYEEAKDRLRSEATDEEVQDSVETLASHCEEIQTQFRSIIVSL